MVSMTLDDTKLDFDQYDFNQYMNKNKIYKSSSNWGYGSSEATYVGSKKALDKMKRKWFKK